MGKPCDKSPHHGYVQDGEVCQWCSPLPAVEVLQKSPERAMDWFLRDLPRTVKAIGRASACMDAIACIGSCVLPSGHDGSPNTGHELADGRRYGWSGTGGGILVWLATPPRPEPAQEVEQFIKEFAEIRTADVIARMSSAAHSAEAPFPEEPILPGPNETPRGGG